MNTLERKCVDAVWAYYERSGRHTLPWRRTQNPYHILVSEVMLQQTQVDRVIPKYIQFLKRFPTMKKLASAPLGEVLQEWQGLGYNRRAKMLHECAKVIVHSFRGRTPKSYAELLTLPGVGPYTAGAVMAFAYNSGVPIVETNIRTVFIHHFFPNETDIKEQQIFAIAERLLDHERPRDWHYALMDYGAYLKKTIGNVNTRSTTYIKQSTFLGSDRQIRGAILKLLVQGSLTRLMLHARLPFDILRIDAQLERLREEGMIVCTRSRYHVPRV